MESLSYKPSQSVYHSKPFLAVKNLLKIDIKSQAYLHDRPAKVHIPVYKRLMDILIAGAALLVTSPLLVLVTILLKIESKAPVFYYSKRVGMAYHIFELIKFRSMVPGADAKIDAMASLNQYQKESMATAQTACTECALGNCKMAKLYIGGKEVCENQYRYEQNRKAVFQKFDNDPRVTTLGKFIRKTSIDELPQLINVLKGEMSIIGNRPLPLYEAEKLTTNVAVERFLAPAGISGLWQVSKRGKKDMSEEERIQLDIAYARNYSFSMDLKIIFMTIPALFQTANS
jgi:lipopolysaccharide/colanic/teichoic acid biosynthesis glycosyltransferase